MTHLRLMLNNTQCAQKHSIQPVDFIRRWSLCYDLSCVVKYIARAAQTSSALSELQMAEWHILKRLLEEYEKNSTKPNASYNHVHHSPFIQRMRKNTFPMMPDVIAQEWGLPLHLRETLFCITAFEYVYHLLPTLRFVLLEQALKSLKEEMHARNPLSTHPINTQGGQL